MKIDRLIGIITLLLQKDKVTAPELAERFEVSRRTINRDMEDICKAGIPIVTTQGYGGGISIAEGYKIDKALFTHDELQMIFTGLKGIDSVSGVSYMERFSHKLSTRERQVTADDFIVIDLASYYQDALREKIEIIKKAAADNRTLTFSYYYEKGEGKREIEPYRLVFKWSSWYVFGYCLKRQDYRLFKLNRLWDLSTGQTFLQRDIPVEKLKFDGFLMAQEMRLKAIFDKSEKYHLIDEYGRDCYQELKDGSMLLERSFVNYEIMRRWVFSFGDKVRIIEPAELREDRLRQAQNIMEEAKAPGPADS